MLQRHIHDLIAYYGSHCSLCPRNISYSRQDSDNHSETHLKIHQITSHLLQFQFDTNSRAHNIKTLKLPIPVDKQKCKEDMEHETIHRIPSWQDVRGSIFYGDASLPAPLLDACFLTFSEYAIVAKSTQQITDNVDKSDFGQINKASLPKAFGDLGIGLSDEELLALMDTVDAASLGFASFCRMVRAIRRTFHYLLIDVTSGCDVSSRCLGCPSDRADRT